MKAMLKNVSSIIIVAIILSSSMLRANSTDNLKGILNDEVLGAWEYTVENVPYEYSSGVIMISKENKEYTIKIQLAAGAIDAENVKIVDNKISFTVYVEGSNVNVNLEVAGDKISGESSSYDGTFAIKGKRMMPE